jgi:hypothetical protein
MKILFAAALLVASTVAGIGSASAEGGCGPGFHRNPYGENPASVVDLTFAPGVAAGSLGECQIQNHTEDQY